MSSKGTSWEGSAGRGPKPGPSFLNNIFYPGNIDSAFYPGKIRVIKSHVATMSPDKSNSLTCSGGNRRVTTRPVRPSIVESIPAFVSRKACLAGIGHRPAAIDDSPLLPLSGVGDSPSA